MPPVEVDYTPKGKDITIQEMKTCKHPHLDAFMPTLKSGCLARRQDWLTQRYYRYPPYW